MKLKLKMTAFLFLLSLSCWQSSAIAAPKILCSGINAILLKDRVDHLQSDKAKHCTLSCFFTWRCGAQDSFELGLLKEIADVFGPGQAEWADLMADLRGIRLGKIAQGASHPDSYCLANCVRIYP